MFVGFVEKPKSFNLLEKFARPNDFFPISKQYNTYSWCNSDVRLFSIFGSCLISFTLLGICGYFKYDEP